MTPRRISLIGLSLLCGAAPCAASADTIVLARDSVVPVVFDSALTLSDSRVGDHFTAHVDSDRDLPSGTKFEGRIVSIRSPRPDRPASMDLEFTAIDLPSGAIAHINALPIPLNKDTVRTDADGRLYVKNDVRKQGEYVLGGALGGYLLGSVFHRRITGLFLGTIVGAIAASSDREHSENTVVDKGQKLGAVFNQDANIDLSATSGEANRSWNSNVRGSDLPPGYTHSLSNQTSGGRGWGGSSNSTPAPTPAPTQTPPVPTPAAPPADISIHYADKTVTFANEVAPYYQGETIMVPLKQMADVMGLSFEKGDKDSAYIENDNDSLKVQKDSVNYRFNGNTGTLSHPIVLKGDTWYGPVELFADLAAKDLVVNGTKLVKDSPSGSGGG